MDSKEKTISGSSEKEGVKVNMEKVAVSPISFILYYNQEVSKNTRKEWDAVDVELEVKDDLGNHYSGEGNGDQVRIPIIFIGVTHFKSSMKMQRNLLSLLVLTYEFIPPKIMAG